MIQSTTAATLTITNQTAMKIRAAIRTRVATRTKHASSNDNNRSTIGTCVFDGDNNVDHLGLVISVAAVSNNNGAVVL
jgi:hypothetical protein